MGNTQTKKEPKTLRARLRQLFPFSWRDLGVSLSFLGLTAILCALLRMIDSSDVFVALIFECAVVLVSRFTDGYLFGLLASFLGVVGVNWIFTYPYMQLNFTISGYPLTFLIMLAVSVVVSALTLLFTAVPEEGPEVPVLVERKGSPLLFWVRSKVAVILPAKS